jgi:hypothetical protein
MRIRIRVGFRVGEARVQDRGAARSILVLVHWLGRDEAHAGPGDGGGFGVDFFRGWGLLVVRVVVLVVVGLRGGECECGERRRGFASRYV